METGCCLPSTGEKVRLLSAAATKGTSMEPRPPNNEPNEAKKQQNGAKKEHFNSLTLLEAASEMHPEWQGGRFCPPPYKNQFRGHFDPIF